MKCPHCLENFFDEWGEYEVEKDADAYWKIMYCNCPSCKKIVIKLVKKNFNSIYWEFSQLIRPKSISRISLSPDIPKNFSVDYEEACLVLGDSAKASAALSRRCLQYLLREKAKTKKKDLSDQIQEVIDTRSLPSWLSENLDAIRNIGNFAAHPIKSQSTGEVVEVESGEAEWNLDVLESLFDFYFVQEKVLERKREELNKKLEDAGKPTMKN